MEEIQALLVMEGYKIDVALSLLMETSLLELSRMEGLMAWEKCFIKTHYFRHKLVLNLRLDITKAIFDKEKEKEKVKWFGLMEAYLKVFGSMMKDLKAE